MLKLVIRSPKLFRMLMRFRRLRPWFQFDLSRLDRIKDEATFAYALQSTLLPNGTYKTTSNLRFKDLDVVISRHLAQFSKAITIHDVAAADGITTVNLSDALERLDIEHTIFFSDKFSILHLRKKGYCQIFYDHDGTFVYADLFGILASPYVPNRFLLSKMLGQCFTLQHSRSAADSEVSLLNPSARLRIEQESLKFFYYDLFESEDCNAPYQLIRCMNALNPAIFKESLLEKAVAKLIANLDDDGLLVIGRTNPQTGENNTSIFRMGDEGLVVVQRVGAGSEIESLIVHSTNQENSNE